MNVNNQKKNTKRLLAQPARCLSSNDKSFFKRKEMITQFEDADKNIAILIAAKKASKGGYYLCE